MIPRQLRRAMLRTYFPEDLREHAHATKEYHVTPRGAPLPGYAGPPTPTQYVTIEGTATDFYGNVRPMGTLITITTYDLVYSARVTGNGRFTLALSERYAGYNAVVSMGVGGYEKYLSAQMEFTMAMGVNQIVLQIAPWPTTFWLTVSSVQPHSTNPDMVVGSTIFLRSDALELTSLEPPSNAPGVGTYTNAPSGWPTIEALFLQDTRNLSAQGIYLMNPNHPYLNENEIYLGTLYVPG